MTSHTKKTSDSNTNDKITHKLIKSEPYTMPKAIPKPDKNGNEQYRPHQTGRFKEFFTILVRKKSKTYYRHSSCPIDMQVITLILSAGAVPGT